MIAHLNFHHFQFLSFFRKSNFSIENFDFLSNYREIESEESVIQFSTNKVFFAILNLKFQIFHFIKWCVMFGVNSSLMCSFFSQLSLVEEKASIVRRLLAEVELGVEVMWDFLFFSNISKNTQNYNRQYL